MVRLKAATANVKTLDPAGIRRSTKLGLNTSAKIEYLDHELHQAGYQVVGLQESCVKGSVTRAQTNYHVTTSGAQPDGHLGVESWIAKELTRGTKVRPRALHPRLFSVLVDGACFCFAHIVAHAPTNATPHEDRKAFWQSLRDELISACKSRLVFLSIDGNATMGAVESIAIPFRDYTPENENGSALRQLLEEVDLYAASMNTGSVLPTWYGGRNQHEGRRIDYVCVSSSLAPACLSAGVDLSVHLSGKDCIDHVIAYVEAMLPERGCQVSRQPVVPGLSRSLIEAPGTQWSPSQSVGFLGDCRVGMNYTTSPC